MASFIPIDLQQKIVANADGLLRWWLHELHGMCPGKLRERFAVGDAFYLIEVVDSRATVCYGTEYRVGQKVEIDLTLPEVEQLRLLNNIAVVDQRALRKATVLIADNKLLTRHVHLPLAVEPDLANVLNYELDRLTPYAVDKVFFAYKVEKRDVAGGTIVVRLVLVEKWYLEHVVSQVENLQLTVSAVCPASGFDFARHSETSRAINLLPAVCRPPAEALLSKSSKKLLLATVMMLISVLLLPVYYHQERIEEIRQDISSFEKKAIQISEKRGELARTLDIRDSLIERKNKGLTKVEVLHQLTHIVPDHTWVTRVGVENGELKIDGESEKASTMIELMESQAAFRDVEFVSPITKNVRTGKERFQIKAKLADKKKLSDQQGVASEAAMFQQ